MQLEQLKTFEDACQILGLEAGKVIPDLSVYPEKDRQALEAQAKLMIVARAANQIANNGVEWRPNWDDSNYKYYPWFWMDGGSSGFRYDDYVNQYSDSNVGSRLCFKSKKVCEYVANQFIDLYRAIMVIE